jgi:hypothetical protein
MDVTPIFGSEIARLRAAGVPGASGRLRDLFDYFAERGADAPSASQGEIAAQVFGENSSDADDATVRVYVHRLRKRIEDFYAANATGESGAVLELPSGVYALRLHLPDQPEPLATDPLTQPVGDRPAATIAQFTRLPVWTWLVLALAVLGVVLLGMRWFGPERPNAIWQPLLESDRPVLVVLGDYYLFGEIDPVRPEEGRLIRDFRVNSPEELVALQEAEPERYGFAEDQGLNYLPFSMAYALAEVAPILADADKHVELIAASALEADMLNRYDIVYLGLFSGMGLLEDVNFMNSTFHLGESYDELRDQTNARLYVSGEARSIASPAFYRDYGYVARADAPGGAVLVVLAGSRDTGLRGIASLATAARLDDELADAAGAPFEALVQITGQKGADLNARLLVARHRP